MIRNISFLCIFVLFFVSCKSEKKNLDNILIHQNIDNYFTKKEIKKYFVNIGLVKPQKAMNIYSKIFNRDFKLVQIIFNEETRAIYSISGIFYINPDKCIKTRNNKINDFKIFTKIDKDFTIFADEQKYLKGSYNRLTSRIGYSHNKDKYFVSLTCYDNRNAYTPTGQPYDTEGELRFEIISDKYSFNQ